MHPFGSAPDVMNILRDTSSNSWLFYVFEPKSILKVSSFVCIIYQLLGHILSHDISYLLVWSTF